MASLKHHIGTQALPPTNVSRVIRTVSETQFRMLSETQLQRELLRTHREFSLKLHEKSHLFATTTHKARASTLETASESKIWGPKKVSDLLVRDQSWPCAIPRRCTIRIRAPPAPHDLFSRAKTHQKNQGKKQQISTDDE